MGKVEKTSAENKCETVEKIPTKCSRETRDRVSWWTKETQDVRPNLFCVAVLFESILVSVIVLDGGSGESAMDPTP